MSYSQWIHSHGLRVGSHSCCECLIVMTVLLRRWNSVAPSFIFWLYSFCSLLLSVPQALGGSRNVFLGAEPSSVTYSQSFVQP